MASLTKPSMREDGSCRSAPPEIGQPHGRVKFASKMPLKSRRNERPLIRKQLDSDQPTESGRVPYVVLTLRAIQSRVRAASGTP